VLRGLLEVSLFVAFYLAVSAWQERNLLSLRTHAPSFELESLDGTHVSTDSLRGKRVLLHFWATWCGVCRREFGSLDAVHQGLASDEAIVSIVADSDDPDAVRRFVKEQHIEYPVLLGTSEVLHAFHVGAFPTNYFLDEHGRITGRTVGMSTRLAMRARLLLAK
jgi:peroxiredoxin